MLELIVVGTAALLTSVLSAVAGLGGGVILLLVVAHKAFVATAAATQVLAHISKLVAFSADGWSITDHADLIAVGIVGVIVGSWLGTRLLDRVSETALDVLFKVVLTALALRVIFTALT